MATLSSIITPTNITTASNTQTLTNKTITGGILNGTLGATTPSTVAATTLSATNAATITANSSGYGLILNGRSSDNLTVVAFRDNTGATNYGGFEGSSSSIKTQIGSGFTTITNVTSTGLAVNGTGTTSGNFGAGAAADGTFALLASSTTQRSQLTLKGSNVVGMRFQSTDINPGERNWGLVNNIDIQGALSLRVGASTGADPTTTTAVFPADGGQMLNTTSRSPAGSAEYLTVKYDPATRTGIAIQATTNTYATNAVLFYGHTSAFAGSIQITATNTIAVVTSSDSRLKKNVREMNDSGSIIDAALPRIFDWNWSDTDEQGRGKDVHGFIAQELHQAFPEAVSVGGDDADKTPWCVDYSKIVPVLVAELKSLRKRLAALEAK